jgi:hypothetical protein
MVGCGEQGNENSSSVKDRQSLHDQNDYWPLKNESIS